MNERLEALRELWAVDDGVTVDALILFLVEKGPPNWNVIPEENRELARTYLLHLKFYRDISKEMT